MALAGMVAIGIVVGIIIHLILGSDGYSWFGEIVLSSVGAILLGLVTGIFVGMRQITPEVMIAALVGAVAVGVVVTLLTFHATGRSFGRS